MNPLIILGLVAAGGYVLLSKSSTSGGGSAVASAQQAALQQQAAAATASAQAFNSQAQALNLTQAQAQEAYDIGLSPQEYVDSGMTGTTTSGVFYDHAGVLYNPPGGGFYG
jgi:hypothetical protein